MARKKTPEFTWGPLSEKQLKVLTWWRKGSAFADYDGIIADGAIRSGKTVSMEFSYVEWAMETFNGYNFAICGKTIESLRRNVIKTLVRQLRARGYFSSAKRRPTSSHTEQPFPAARQNWRSIRNRNGAGSKGDGPSCWLASPSCWQDFSYTAS